MGDIVIRGIKIPKEGTVTFKISPTGDIYSVGMYANKYKGKAIKLPELHGALKDVNTIISGIKKQYCHNSRFCDERCSCCDFAEIISVIEHDVPTILEASK